MPTFELEIVTPERTVYSGTVESLRAPGSEGGFGVLSGHHPMLAALGVGPVFFQEAGGSIQQMAISGGFSEVLRDRVTLLAETAEVTHEIDVARAEAARDRARERLTRRMDSDVDAVRAEVSLARALNRLKVVGGI